MKTLLINAHPDYTNAAHYSAKLQALFLKKFREKFADDKNEELTVLNLYAQDLPQITKDELLAIWNKQAAGEVLTAQENQLATQSADLLTQFKAHHRIVIVSPLHNFNITSRMKDYLDNILIARETFRYLDAPDARGKVSTGLMTDDYRVLILFASGSIYTAGFYQALDFAPRYLQSMFQEVMGFEHFDIVRAEGTAVLSEEEILAKAAAELEDEFEQFYLSSAY